MKERAASSVAQKPGNRLSETCKPRSPSPGGRVQVGCWGGRLRTMSSSRWLRQASAQEGQSDAGVHQAVRAGPLGRGLGWGRAAQGGCETPTVGDPPFLWWQACARREEARFLTSTRSVETALKVTRVVPMGTRCACVSVCPSAPKPCLGEARNSCFLLAACAGQGGCPVTGARGIEPAGEPKGLVETPQQTAPEPS